MIMVIILEGPRRFTKEQTVGRKPYENQLSSYQWKELWKNTSFIR